MAQGTNNAAELTAEQVRTMLIQPLESESVFLASGPQIFDTDGNTVRVPKAPTSKADDLTWVAENELIPDVDHDWSELKLLPSGMKSVKTLTRFSNELARQSIVNLEGAIRQRLVADVAAKVDSHLLSAEGDGITTPRGLFAYEGIQTLDASEADLDTDVLMDAYGLALGANVDPAALTLFIRPEDYMAVRKLKDNDGRYLLQPDVSTGAIMVPMLGATARVSSRVPANKAALVDMSQIAVARDLAPSVRLLTERYADYDQQALRVVTRLDAGPMNPQAVIEIDHGGDDESGE